MLTWILVGVIAISILWILVQRSYIKRLLRLSRERTEEINQEREEHNQKLDEEKKRHEEEIADRLKRIASSCFRAFFDLYYDDLDFGKSEATKNAVRKTFEVLFLSHTRYFSDEELLDFLREEHPDEFKGVKVKVPSPHEMLLGDLEV